MSASLPRPNAEEKTFSSRSDFWGDDGSRASAARWLEAA